MVDFTVERLAIPDALDAAGGDDFVEMTAVRNEIEAEIIGFTELSVTPQDLLPRWQDPYSPQQLHVARIGRRIVGRVVIGLSAEAEAHSADVWVEVLSEFRGRGIGSALFEAAVGVAEGAGRTALQASGFAPNVDGPRLDSPTGHGSVALEAPGTRFALARGFQLGQVARASRLPLPFAGAEDRLAAALAGSGADYRLVTWNDTTPEEWLSDLAWLHSRMSTDAPAGELDVPEEAWDAERVRSLDAIRAKTGTTMLVAAAEHVPSGTLAAFTELSVPPQLDLAVYQQDTLVLREHRGHQLGMLVKLANLTVLERARPGHPSVVTFNAEENHHMLAVNVSCGFTAFASAGAWKRDL